MTPWPFRAWTREDDPRTWTLLERAADAIRVDAPVDRVAPVVFAAWAASHAGPDAPGSGDRPRTGGRAPRSRTAALVRSGRRFLGPAVAGGIALAAAAGGVTASTTPGAPLYATRLAVEVALLPAPGSATRAPAELDYADRRLAEARDALARHDDAAAVAAIGAFTADVRTLSGEQAAKQLSSSDLADVRDRLARLDVELDMLRSDRLGIEVDAALDAASHELSTLRGSDGRPPRTRALEPHQQPSGAGRP